MRHLEGKEESHATAKKPLGTKSSVLLEGRAVEAGQAQLVERGTTNHHRSISGAESLVLTLINSGVRVAWHEMPGKTPRKRSVPEGRVGFCREAATHHSPGL